MIRLILLLLGPHPLRRQWGAFLALSLLCAVLGIIFTFHLFHLAIIVATDVIGALLVLEGGVRLFALASIGFPNATLPVIKSLGFFFLGLIAIDVPWSDNLVATVFLGSALLLDGLFRLAAAVVIRSSRWVRAAIAGLIEIGMTAFIWLPAPLPYRYTVPFCIGIGLLAASWNLALLGFQVRRLKPGASVTDLPLFAGPNWHGRGLLPAAHDEPASWDNEQALTVHIWTPLGSAVNPQRRPLFDRYIAAVDQNGVVSTGHSAISLPPDIYISLFPADDIDRTSTEFTRLLRATPENDVPAAYHPSLEDECKNWRQPDREVVFHRFNSAALHAFLARYKAQPVYNLTSRNCSSTVALSLDAAVEGAFGQDPLWRRLLWLLTDPAMWLLALCRARAEAMTWTPGLILDYAQMLQHILQGRRETWWARLRETRARYVSHRRALAAEGQPTLSNLPAIVSLIATGLIFGLTYGLSAPLVALVLRDMGFGESFIGANAAMHAIGVLLVAPFLPGLAWRIGPKLPITAALLGAAVLLALFPEMPTVWLWFPLRLLLGVVSETMFVMSETWLNQLSNDKTRTQTIAGYTVALSAGFALGPVILTLVGSEGLLPFLVAAGVALLALLSVAMPWVRAPAFDRASHHNPLKYLALAPVALFATLVNAALETAGMSFLPIYAIRLGWGEESATLLLSVLLVGALLLQLPIGWLGDRIDRRRLVIGLGCLATLGALAWPYALTSPFLAYPLLFLWGGVFVGIYTVMMAQVGSQFKGGDLVSIYAVMSLFWGLGAFVGPSIAGALLDHSKQGLPYFAAMACALFTTIALLRRRGI